MQDKNILEGQTVRYFEQGKSAIGSGSSDSMNRGNIAFVDRVHQNGAADLTVLTPTGIIQKSAVPEANWQPTQYTERLLKSDLLTA